MVPIHPRRLGTLGGWAEVLGEASVFLSVDKGSDAELAFGWSIPLWKL